MFVISIKSSKIKIILFCVFIAIVCTCALLIFLGNNSSSAVAEGSISLRADDEKKRIAFLSQFGWDVDIEPAEVKEIMIPYEFDDVYNEYNALQKKQSFNLEKYKGEIVKKWSYNINNFPGYENKEDYVRANLLIYNGNVIAADITVLGEKAKVYVIDFPKDVKNDTKT